MKRLITIILSISIVFPMCTTVSLASPANVEYKDMIYLSDESTLEINERLFEYVQGQTLTEKELDNYLWIILQEYRDEIQAAQSLPVPTYDFGYSWNPAELALSEEHPTQWNVYRSVCLWARNAALAIYITSACENPGVGDAFRHTYWNARLMTRFKEIFAWDRDKCLETTKMWTDAHEQDGEPWSILHEMDILNNYAGRNIGYEHFNESEGFLLQEAERYVDEGLCWEIGEVDGEQVLIRTTNKDKR